MVWAKVAAAGVWEDGMLRRLFTVAVSGDNRIILNKDAANNSLTWTYTANATSESQNTTSLSNTDFACYVITWSKSGDSVDRYIDGVASGSADTGLGVFLGDLVNTTVVIAASSATPGNVWSGDMAHVALWNTPLTAAQIAYLSKP